MKINSLNYQRNGVSGEGFYICQYALDGEWGLIATFRTYNDERTINRETCRAIDPEDLTKCYRGDIVADELNKWFFSCFKGKEPSFVLYDMIEVINHSKQLTL